MYIKAELDTQRAMATGLHPLAQFPKWPQWQKLAWLQARSQTVPWICTCAGPPTWGILHRSPWPMAASRGSALPGLDAALLMRVCAAAQAHGTTPRRQPVPVGEGRQAPWCCDEATACSAMSAAASAQLLHFAHFPSRVSVPRGGPRSSELVALA